MDLRSEIFYPTENLLLNAANKFNGRYYEDDELISHSSQTNNKAKTQKAYFEYKTFPFTAVSSIFGGILIILDLGRKAKIGFRILPKSSEGFFKKVFNKMIGKKGKNEHFIYYGHQGFGALIKKDDETINRYKGEEYVIELRKDRSQKLSLKPSHGLSNFEELANCLEVLVCLANLLEQESLLEY